MNGLRSNYLFETQVNVVYAVLNILIILKKTRKIIFSV